jgi:hypothetical protein
MDAASGRLAAPSWPERTSESREYRRLARVRNGFVTWSAAGVIQIDDRIRLRAGHSSPVSLLPGCSPAVSENPCYLGAAADVKRVRPSRSIASR